MTKKIVTDTTDFFSIDYGDVIALDDKQYSVTGIERERRFGSDDPKYWVKRAKDMETGEKKIIKLAYFESFETVLDGVTIKRFRNPMKEGDVLESMGDHASFMHGKVHRDDKENIIRVLDIVPGANLFFFIGSLTMDHKTYFHTVFPSILKRLVGAFEAIRFLHINGFNHGDIRSDHIIVERTTGNYVWIDFDYDYEASENQFGVDVFEAGHTLAYVIGKGSHTLYMIKNDPATYKDLFDHLEPADFAILDRSRFLNLKKLYPYIPETLNDILMHFTFGAHVYYEMMEEIIKDLKRCLATAFK